MNNCPDDQPSKEPRYWNWLSESDRAEYNELKKELSSSNYKNKRNRSKETFATLLSKIKNFVIKGDANDNNRALVCGIVWLEKGVAINTHQLCLLTGKCKSSINGSFQRLGFGTMPTGTDSSGDLINKFPLLKSNFGELRQWTIRKKINDGDDVSPPEADSIPNESSGIDLEFSGSPMDFNPSFSLSVDTDNDDMFQFNIYKDWNNFSSDNEFNQNFYE